MQDLPVILKWHNFQSIEKALNFFMELQFCKSDVYYPNRRYLKLWFSVYMSYDDELYMFKSNIIYVMLCLNLDNFHL